MNPDEVPGSSLGNPLPQPPQPTTPNQVVGSQTPLPPQSPTPTFTPESTVQLSSEVGPVNRPTPEQNKARDAVMAVEDDLSKCPFLPSNGTVLVKPLELQQHDRISVAQESLESEASELAVVLRVGGIGMTDYGVKVFIDPLKCGDIIVHKSWGHQNFKWNHKPYKLVDFKDIKAINPSVSNPQNG